MGRTKIFILILMLVSTLMASGTALAVSPHFVSASALITSGNLVVSWKEAGLGNNLLITYIASANATATYACINGGGNHPQAANKETVNGPVSGTGTFDSGKNGQITANLTLNPPSAGSFSCPGGQKLKLAFVSYTNISLQDTTTPVTANIPGTVSTCLLPGVGICQ